MAKTRLNVGKREILKQLVGEKVKHTEYDDDINQLEAKIDAWVIKEVEKQWPTKDMDVLKKYDKAGNYSYVNIKIGSLENSTHRDIDCWYFLDKEKRWFPDTYRDRVIIPDETISADLDEWLLLTDTRQAHLYDLKKNYFILIDSSRNYEEVVEVWDEALEVSDRMITSGSSLVALSRETIDAIKEDTASRKLTVT